MPTTERLSGYDCVSGGLPDKHGFMRGASMHDAESTLHVLVTRHPYEWLASMQVYAYISICVFM